MGVPADYHWSVCVPLPIARQKTAILFVCLPDTLFCYSVGAFSLPILVVSVQLCPFGWYVISAGHFPQKSPSRNLKIGFSLSPLPNHALLPLTHDLTVPCIGRVQAGEVLGLARASLPCMSKVCMLLMRLPWLACTVCRPFLTIFWFPFPLWLALFGLGLAWRWALLSFSPPFFLLPSPVIPLYHSCCKVILPQSGWASLGLPFILLLMAQQDHWFFCYITSRLLCPICFPLDVPDPFASLGLPRPFSDRKSVV